MLSHAVAGGQGIELLSGFVESHDRGSVTFRQETFGDDGALLNETGGKLSFVRPDKFRLEYYDPFPQLILGDGENIWYYDRELGQATLHDYAQMAGHSALVLLTGERVQENFMLTAPPGGGGDYHWVHAVPTSAERTFERVRIAFSRDGGVLSRMEIEDVFANVLVLHFSEVGGDVADDAFVADFPEGTVVLDGGG